MFRCVVRVVASAACVALVCVPAAQAQVQPYGTNDFGGFRNILPPGTSGFDDAAQLAQFEATGARPEHNDDQLSMYSGLTTAAGSITPATIPDYFKDATFGVPAGDVEGSESPEAGVTIVRDKQFGVPHIYGDTRAELMFGIGYATAEDRLFFIDGPPHSGPGSPAARTSRWTRRCGLTSPTPSRTSSIRSTTCMTSRAASSCFRTPRTTSTGSTPTSPRPSSR